MHIDCLKYEKRNLKFYGREKSESVYWNELGKTGENYSNFSFFAVSIKYEERKLQSKVWIQLLETVRYACLQRLHPGLLRRKECGKQA